MWKTILGFTTAIALCTVTHAQNAALSVGDPAPPLTVGKWIKGGPIEEFKPETPYVVEFWATWCGPCRESIPHLTELQTMYKDQGLEVIGVSISEPDYSAVEPYVEEMGEKMQYNVAIDEVPEGSNVGKMAENWMRAAGQNGIPTAFIVQNRKIAWIGHPLTMDEPLAQVISGEFNIEEHLAVSRRMDTLREELQQVEPGNYQKVLSLFDQAIQDQPKLEAQLGYPKFNILLQTGEIEKALEYGETLLDGTYKDDSNALNNMAWALVAPESMVEVGEAGVELALKIAQHANELTDGTDPNVLDTLARAHFEAGNVSEAIRVQEKAVELSGGEVPELKQRLEEYRSAAKQSGA